MIGKHLVGIAVCVRHRALKNVCKHILILQESLFFEHQNATYVR